MKILILDDERQAITVLQSRLKRYTYVSDIDFATNTKEGMSKMQQLHPDVLFLDVDLSEMSGLSFLKFIDDDKFSNCHVVIYTGHSNYMLPALRLRVFDFLLKPVSQTELDTIMNRLSDDMVKPYSFVPETKNEDKLSNIIVFSNSVDFRVVSRHEICFFEYDNKKSVWTAVVRDTNRPFPLNKNLKKDMILSCDDRYVQISRTCIINLNYLQGVKDGVCLFYPPFDHITSAKVSRLYRQRLIDKYTQL